MGRGFGAPKTTPQRNAKKHEKPTFGSAAKENLTFSPPDEEVKSSPSSTTRYFIMQVITILFDYGYLFGSFFLYDKYVCGDKYTPLRATLIVPFNATCMTTLDMLKAFLFFDLIAQDKAKHLNSLKREFFGLFSVSGIRKIFAFSFRLLKGEGIVKEFRDKTEARRGLLYHMFYFTKIALICVPTTVYFMLKANIFHMTPLFQTVAVWGEGESYETKVSAFAIVYLEYLLMSFVKDALSMNVLHQMMHRQFYSLHKVHHMPMRELSMANVWFFDLPDIAIENVLSPLILIAIKFFMCPACAGAPQIHYLSFILLAVTDLNIHSVSPYSVGFYNPILDSILKCNVSHNLHHALNVGHYTVWPWHQLKGVASYNYSEKKNLDGSRALDMRAYNKTFKTNFPE